MHVPRGWYTATMLKNGKVLVAGGSTGSAISAAAELFDPTTNTWTQLPAMSQARAKHSATLLPDGRVLVAGGKQEKADGYSYALASAELFDPLANKWIALSPLASARANHSATLLLDGRVLVAGGQNCSPYCTDLSDAELFNPSTKSWSTAAPMLKPRMAHTATLLVGAGGNVLVVGGGGVALCLSAAEKYDPAHLPVGRPLSALRPIHRNKSVV